MDLGKILMVNFFLLFLTTPIEAQVVEVKDSWQVEKSLIGRNFKTVKIHDLGTLEELKFELLSAKDDGESIIIEFILWYCPYYAQIDIEQRVKDCPCNNIYFSYDFVSTKQVASYAVGEKISRRKYKMLGSSDNLLCINAKQTIRLKKSSSYELIFKLDNGGISSIY